MLIQFILSLLVCGLMILFICQIFFTKSKLKKISLDSGKVANIPILNPRKPNETDEQFIKRADKNYKSAIVINIFCILIIKLLLFIFS